MLTERQQAILDFINEYVESNGFPPSIREIGKNFGIYPATVQDHVSALERKGHLQKKRFQSRTISVSASSRRSPGSAAPAAALTTGVPIVGTVAAGAPLLAQENIQDTIHLPKNWAPEGAFLLKVQGDSMEGAHILAGDYVLVQPQSTAGNGEIVVALIEDEATVKRFYRSGKSITLKAENPKFGPIEVDPKAGKSFRLIGRVTGVLRMMRQA